MKIISRNLLACVAIVGAITTWSCSNNPSTDSQPTNNQPTGRAIQAAIVPEADIVMRLNVEAMKATPLAKQMQLGQDSLHQKADFKAQYEKFQKLTGLAEKDVRAVVFSADADSIILDGGMTPEHFETISAMAAIELAKPADLDKLMAGIKAVYEDEATVSVTKTQMNESEALVITDDRPDNPYSVYLTVSNDPKTLFLAYNQPSLEAAQKRHRTGNAEQIPASLQAVVGMDSQASFAFIAPDSVRKAIQEQLTLAQTNPQAAMMAGFITPFKDFRSMAISVQLGTDLQLDISCDLGQEQASTQVAALLQTIVVPMLSGMMAESSGKISTAISDQLNISVEGTVLHVGIKLPCETLLAYQKKAQQKGPMMSQQY